MISAVQQAFWPRRFTALDHSVVEAREQLRRAFRAVDALFRAPDYPANDEDVAQQRYILAVKIRLNRVTKSIAK